MLNVKNNARSTITEDLTTSETDVTVNDASQFPTSTPFRITINDEIMEVTGISSDTFTVTRAMESTSAQSHSSGDVVKLNVTAGMIEEIHNSVLYNDGDTATGDYSFNSGILKTRKDVDGEACPLNLENQDTNTSSGSVNGVGIKYQLLNSNDNIVDYGGIGVSAEDDTAGAEDGGICWRVMHGGSFEDAMNVTPTGIVLNQNQVDRDFRIESDTYANALFVEGSSGNLGFGTGAPQAKLDAIGFGATTPVSSWYDDATWGMAFANDGGTQSSLGNFYAGDTNTDRPLFFGRRAGGTLASPTTVADGDWLMSLIASGYDGSDFEQGASMTFAVDGTVSTGTVPTSVIFETGDNFSDRSERLRINSDGNVGINDTAPSEKLSVDGNAALTGYFDVGDFADGSEPASSTGRMFYSNEENTLAYYDANGVEIDVGMDMTIRAKNVSGGSMSKGDIVYLTGSSGSTPTVDLAKADAEATALVIGVVKKDSIPDNGVGKVALSGTLSDCDTSSYSAGDTLYLSATTAGECTTTAPTSPNYEVRIGTVIASSSTDGSIVLDIKRTYDLTPSEEAQLENIDSQTITNTQWGYLGNMSAQPTEGVSELESLTSDEVSELLNIGSTGITNTQWGYLGSLDQSLSTTDSPSFTGLSIDGNITQTTGDYLATDEVRAIDADGLKLFDDGGNGIFVEDGGNVGIGTTSPDSVLHASTDTNTVFKLESTSSGSYPYIQILDADQEWRLVQSQDDSIRLRDYTASNDILEIETGAPAASLYIDSSGQLGLGTATPASPLEIDNSTDNLGFDDADADGGSSADGYIEVSVGGSTQYIPTYNSKQ